MTEESSTLRLENIPVGTPDTEIEDLFCDFGPIKRCFVVKPKKGAAKKTLGYIQFAQQEDAQSALQSAQEKGISVQGQDIKVILPKCKSLHFNFNYVLQQM